MRDLKLVDETRHGHLAVSSFSIKWPERGAIVNDNGGTTGQTTDEPVPHHPSGCCKIKQSISGADVAV